MSFDEEGEDDLSNRRIRANQTMLHAMSYQINANMEIRALIEGPNHGPPQVDRPVKLNYRHDSEDDDELMLDISHPDIDVDTEKMLSYLEHTR